MLKSHFALSCIAALAVAACGGGAATSTGSGGTTPAGSDPGGSSQGSSPSFYLPFVATSSNGGETGLFVVPSDNLAATPVFVTQTPSSAQSMAVLALSKELAPNNSNVVTSSSPYALLYTATGSDGNAHVYALNLSDVAVAPAATQVSSLSLSSVADICSILGSAQTEVSDPTTLFVVLHTNAGGQSNCGSGGDVYQVIHYADSATTAPTVVDITTSMPALGASAPPYGLVPLYQTSGALGGMVLLNSTTGDLDFYSDDTFTNPTVLAAGVTSWSDIVDDSAVDNTGGVGATTAFLSVTTSNGTSLWRVTSSGTASTIYSASGSLQGVADQSNVYFTDTVLLSGQKIYQEAISGGTPAELYGTTVSGLTIPPQYRLVGSNGTVLVLTTSTLSTSGNAAMLVATLPVGTPATPTNIAGPFSGIMTAALCPATFGDVTSDDLLLNVTLGASNGSTATTTYSTEVLTPAGAVKQAILTDSTFALLPGCGNGFGSVLQISGITDTGGGYGGGTVSALNLSSFSTTPLSTTSGNGSYTIPSGDTLSVAFLSDTIGLGAVFPQAGRVAGGIGVDLSKDLIVPVSVPYSDVTFLPPGSIEDIAQSL